MKFKLVLFTLLPLLISKVVLSQSDTVLLEKNTKFDGLIGICQRTDLQRGEFSGYFFKEYAHYSPKKEVITLLKNKIYSYTITLVLGTWCSDSREQVPGFFKILDELDYNSNYLEIICVNREKVAGIDISALKIERVPTFIFFSDGIEKGRITETPLLTLEEDIYNLLSR
jgi:hypothetical protein